jgi:adhesin transport system membrane fusion protein
MASPAKPRRVNKADVPFLRAARAAQIADSHPFAGSSLLLLVLFLLVAYLWADNASLDEVTRGEGAVVPSSREQVIQSLEGGILAELTVREGDIVEKGQVLLRIDDTRSGASLREGELKSQSLRAEIARLQAEAAGTSPQFPKDIEAAVVERERKNFVSRLTAVEESAASLKRNLELAEKELGMTQPMVARGAVSEVEVLRLQRQIIELKGQIQDRRNSFKAEARGKQAEKEAELSGIMEVLTAKKDEVSRSLVRSPMRGTVKNIKVTTLGGVIGPGQDIMEIIPIEERLLIEAKIRPADVAFLHAGQQATVKLTAYDYTIYGSLRGHLEHISADTLTDENPPHERFYRVYVRTDSAALNGKKGPLPVIPGMVATVEVLTGHKTVLEYLLKPVLKTRDNALHER